MLSDKQKLNIDNRMAVGRDLAKGSMELYMAFDTDEEVTHAQKWLKGKKKARVLTVGLRNISNFPLPIE